MQGDLGPYNFELVFFALIHVFHTFHTFTFPPSHPTANRSKHRARARKVKNSTKDLGINTSLKIIRSRNVRILRVRADLRANYNLIKVRTTSHINQRGRQLSVIKGHAHDQERNLNSLADKLSFRTFQDN